MDEGLYKLPSKSGKSTIHPRGSLNRQRGTASTNPMISKNGVKDSSSASSFDTKDYFDAAPASIGNTIMTNLFSDERVTFTRRGVVIWLSIVVLFGIVSVTALIVGSVALHRTNEHIADVPLLLRDNDRGFMGYPQVRNDSNSSSVRGDARPHDIVLKADEDGDIVFVPGKGGMIVRPPLPGARVILSTVQEPDEKSEFNVVRWEIPVWNDEQKAFWNPGDSAAHLSVPEDGRYMFGAFVNIQVVHVPSDVLQSGGGVVDVSLQINGVETCSGRINGASTGSPSVKTTVSCIAELEQSDRLVLVTSASVGTTYNLLPRTNMWIQRM